MKPITLLHPKRLCFGNDCISQFVEDYTSLGYKKLLVVTAPPVLPLISAMLKALSNAGVQIAIFDEIVTEPEIDTLNRALATSERTQSDSVLGIGGGSVLDVAKLVAALHNHDQAIEEVFGIGQLTARRNYLVCMPTTAGTGSEVSPNAILLDPVDKLKKGVISPYLVPDASYVDPLLTRTVPAAITASTGMDALTHCIEAYANRFAHPVIDLYALEGVRLIGASLKQGVKNGDDLGARARLALGSLYGGLCLGPVNTAAVHALSYPLGGEFHVPHGLSNAVLLPHVIAFNLSAGVARYARIALALGARSAGTEPETAEAGVEILRELIRDVGIPSSLSALNVPREALDSMAESALTVQRLLKNNLREISLADARRIYVEAYA